MREYNVKYGSHKGIHPIYENPEEALKHNIPQVLDEWWKANEGDWVKCDDGYVMKCLQKRKLVNPTHKSGQYTDQYIFPTGSVGVYYNKDGVAKIYNKLYGGITRINRTSVGNTPVEGRWLTAPKAMFIGLVREGVNPYTAYIKAFKYYNKPITVVKQRTHELFLDPVVAKELKEDIMELTDKVREKVLEKTNGHVSIDEAFIENLSIALTRQTKTVDENIKQLMLYQAVFPKEFEAIQLSISKSNNRKEIAQASYEEELIN